MARRVTLQNSPVGKVTAVVLRRRDMKSELLVFDHPLDEGGSMVQLPAGTIDQDEEPEAAAARELREETGVQATLEALVGIRDEEWQGQARRRWIYLFGAPDGLPGEWPSTCDCGAKTRCHWLPFDMAEIVGHQQPWLQMAREHSYSRSRATSNRSATTNPKKHL
jgi:8-oxo-dGTP pyrophosphatase MutT (NUDIX family)